MRARMCIGVLAILLLVGCAPSEQAVREAIEATVAAMPTATVEATPESTAAAEATATPAPTATAESTATVAPTAVPLGELDLGPLLIVEGDLPDNLEGDFVEEGTGRFDRDDVAAADNLVSQGFYDTEAERPGGNVIVYVYEDKAVARQTYIAISTHMRGLLDEFWEDRDDVGEEARLENNGNDNLHLAFLRCHAFVEVFMQTPREFDIVNYAQRLDERLAAVVCPAG